MKAWVIKRDSEKYQFAAKREWCDFEWETLSNSTLFSNSEDATFAIENSHLLRTGNPVMVTITED